MPKTEKTWEENLRVNFNKWTSGLALTEDRAPSSPDHYRQVVEETTAREAELARDANREDDGLIRVVPGRDSRRACLRFVILHRE